MRNFCIWDGEKEVRIVGGVKGKGTVTLYVNSFPLEEIEILGRERSRRRKGFEERVKGSETVAGIVGMELN